MSDAMHIKPSTTADVIRSNVDDLLRQFKVSFSVRYVGATKRDDWECDSWRFTFSKGRAVYDGDYFTGLGHRKDKLGRKNPYPFSRSIEAEDWNKQFLKPVAPLAADILYSLLLDAGAADESFDDWCDNYGEDNDSIKAFNVYRACCETAGHLRRIFNREELTALQEAVRDL